MLKVLAPSTFSFRLLPTISLRRMSSNFQNYAVNDAPEANAFLKRVSSLPHAADSAAVDDVLAASVKDESDLRGLFATDRQNARLSNPYVGLVSVFDAPSTTGIHKTRARVVKDDSDLDRSYVFPLPEEKRRKTGESSMVDSLSEFQKRWAIFTEGSLSQLTDWNNVVAAGGSVLGCLLPMSDKDTESKRAVRKYFHGTAYPTSDVDLFLWGLNAEQVRLLMFPIRFSLT